MIISHVKSDPCAVEACTRACHCLRAVSLEHYVGARLVVSEINSFDHLISFLSAHSRVGAKIRRLKLTGEQEKVQDRAYLPLTPVDHSVVLRLMQRLPNLTELVFNNFIYEPSTQIAIQRSPRPQQDIPGPFRLKQLTFGSWYYVLPHKNSTSGLLHILSLFDVDELYIHVLHREFGDSASLNPAGLRRSLEVQKLRMNMGSMFGNGTTTGILLRALAETIQPGTLCTLDVCYYTGHDVAAVGKLLASAGEGLTSLTLRPCPPFADSKRMQWKDPLDSMWLRFIKY